MVAPSLTLSAKRPLTSPIAVTSEFNNPTSFTRAFPETELNSDVVRLEIVCP